MTENEVTVTQAFWSRVDKRGEDECWPWRGGRNALGYGRFFNGVKSRTATQVSWEIENGLPFPYGKLACHTCDNPPCVNPKHIWPGTQSENLKDCVAKGRHRVRPSDYCHRGHALIPSNRRSEKCESRCIMCDRMDSAARKRRQRTRQREAANHG